MIYSRWFDPIFFWNKWTSPSPSICTYDCRCRGGGSTKAHISSISVNLANLGIVDERSISAVTPHFVKSDRYKWASFMPTHLLGTIRPKKTHPKWNNVIPWVGFIYVLTFFRYKIPTFCLVVHKIETINNWVKNFKISSQQKKKKLKLKYR